ncbi:MAG: YdcF family protein [Spirochaetes bacterium]|nr:YdcF family protein [Spirochaetota bacterium]MBN2772563.1 YdcF family protein [Spirochaetota bacterium]
MIRNNIKTILLFFIIFPLIVFMFTIFTNLRILKYGSPVYTNIDTCPEKYCAIVLGAGVVQNMYLSPVLEDRVKTAVALYKAGKVKKLLMSGANHTKNYNEVKAMKNHAVKWGVNPKDIFLDYAGFSTYESMFRAQYIFGIKEAVIITQGFHVNRSVYLAKKFDINAVGLVADRRRYIYIRQYRLREKLARVKAWTESIILRPLPSYLGDPIPISGDGRVTHDL